MKNNKAGLYIILSLVCVCGYFLFLGEYPLLDVDETRYVNMAREMLKTHDFLTLYLNGEYFFEKPPLFFWIECLSFKLSGNVSEWSARLPIVLLSLLPLGLLFGLCKKVRNTRFSVISSAVLLTCLEYILITKIAILDSVFTSLVTASCLTYFYTFFVDDKNKKYFWYLTYIFSALAVMAKGIPGVVIPAVLVSICTWIFKTYKETIKYVFGGILVFLAITIPWHFIMLKMYPSLFFEEYIVKHHILRFLGSKIIDRNQPWYFYLITLLWGLFPHIFIFLPELFKKTVKCIKLKNLKLSFQSKNNYEKFLLLNTIASLIILLFFSSSRGKLITYIMPVYPFLAVLIGDIWERYIINNDRLVKNSVISLNIVLLTSAVILCFAKFFLPSQVYPNFFNVQIASIVLIFPYVIYNTCMLYKNRRFRVFLSLVLFMGLFAGILTPLIYKFNYSFGQNDLIKYAKLAKESGKTISTYKTGSRYSLLYYSELPLIDFHNDEDEAWLKRELQRTNNILIIRNREIKNLPVPVKAKYKGTKYSVIE